ncbi:MAG: ABC transporter permease [Undibacterium sp.]|nr:ABC transporter permease [Undibacterium sp.]
MKIRDLKIAWRVLAKDRVHSLMVILGLSVSFAACFLLLAYARYAYTYDAHIPDADRIFLVKHRVNAFDRPVWVDFMPFSVRDTLSKSGIPFTSSAVDSEQILVQNASGLKQLSNRTQVNPSFAQMFAVHTIAGDINSTLNKSGEIAVTTRTAQQIFGKIQALGQTILIAGETYRVGAIIVDPPSNTTVPYQILQGTKRDLSRNYIKLSNSSDLAAVQKVIQEAADHSNMTRVWAARQGGKDVTKKVIEVRLTSLRNAYFDTEIIDIDRVIHGDEKNVLALSLVALMILFLAAINYVNLAVARTIRRQREIGVYKLLGASRARIIGQFLTESLLVMGVANALGVLSAWLCLPFFSELMNRPLDSLLTPVNCIASVLFSLVVGALMSAYPIWVALTVNANQALLGRGNHESTGGMQLRRALTVLQFSMAMGLAAVSLAIAWQSFFITHGSLGFDPSNLLVLRLNSPGSEANWTAFRSDLLHLSEVQDVATSEDALGRTMVGFNMLLKRDNGQSIVPVGQGVSPNFFTVHGIQALAGRAFDPKIDSPISENIIVINEAATRALGYANPQEAVGKFVLDASAIPLQIIGVVPNSRYQSAREMEAPRVYQLRSYAGLFSIKIRGDFDAARNQIGSVWRKHFPNEIFDLQASHSLIAKNYEEDLRLSRLLSGASILALLIAAVGIYVLSSYNVQRKAQEIAIRKIYGARARAIVFLVAKEFVVILLAGTLVGLPLAAWAISHYMASFVERAPMSFWSLSLALAVTSITALLATWHHVRVAINAVPMTVMRG